MARNDDLATVGDYANGELLVDGDWLQARLSDDRVRIVDCDGAAAYGRAHIPGAVFSPAHPFKRPDNHRLVMGPEDFAAAMSAIGIDNETMVVAYDTNHATSAARLWWCLAYYGHTNARILDGGWARWLAEGRPVTMAASLPEPATFTPRTDESQLATAEYVLSAIDDPGIVILDVRSDEEWRGEDSRGNPRAGRIPGSVHLDYRLCMLAEQPEGFKDAAAIRDLLEAEGVTPDKEVVTFCQGGGRAAQAAMTLRLMGYGRVRNYDGSFGEWSRLDGAPVE
jgi:thiosulfate/3-mercaptopyruvate sulfurtransferase